MPINRALKILHHATEEINKDWEYRRYLVLLPHMTKENYKSFSEFYESAKPIKVDARPKDDIMNEILEGG